MDHHTIAATVQCQNHYFWTTLAHAQLGTFDKNYRWHVVYEVRQQGAIGIYSRAQLFVLASDQMDALEHARFTWYALGYEVGSPVSTTEMS